MSKKSVFVGLTTMGTVADGLHYNLRRLAERYADDIEFIYPNHCVRRLFHDYARSEMVKEFLDSGADILWFIDSDVVPPLNVLDLVTLHSDDWKVAGAPYPVFMDGGRGDSEVLFTVYRKGPTGGLHPSSIPMTGLDFVDGMATGCLFIKREVLKDIPAPAFEFKYEPSTRLLIEGEDIGFCRKLSERGIQVFTDYSMVCKHFKMIDLLDVNNYAMNYAKRTLDTFQSTFKKQVKEIMDAKRKPVPSEAKLVDLGGQPISSLLQPARTGLVRPFTGVKA